MQYAITVTVAVAGLFFSIMFALLLEEFIFGAMFHLLRPVKAAAARPQEDLFGASEQTRRSA